MLAFPRIPHPHGMDPRVKPEDDESTLGAASSHCQEAHYRHPPKPPSPAKSAKQLVPFGIALLDQLDLPLTWPALQGFLTLDGVADVEVLLIPDEAMHAISRGEARALARLVFRQTTGEVIGHADIDRAALLAGGHVNVAGHGERLVAAKLYASLAASLHRRQDIH